MTKSSAHAVIIANESSCTTAKICKKSRTKTADLDTMQLTRVGRIAMMDKDSELSRRLILKPIEYRCKILIELTFLECIYRRRNGRQQDHDEVKPYQS